MYPITRGINDANFRKGGSKKTKTKRKNTKKSKTRRK
jgi:hypothetical protein